MNFVIDKSGYLKCEIHFFRVKVGGGSGVGVIFVIFVGPQWTKINETKKFTIIKCSLKNVVQKI